MQNTKPLKRIWIILLIQILSLTAYSKTYSIDSIPPSRLDTTIQISQKAAENALKLIVEYERCQSEFNIVSEELDGCKETFSEYQNRTGEELMKLTDIYANRQLQYQTQLNVMSARILKQEEEYSLLLKLQKKKANTTKVITWSVGTAIIVGLVAGLIVTSL